MELEVEIITDNYNSEIQLVEYEGTENSLFKNVGKMFLKIMKKTNYKTIELKSNLFNLLFQKRGTYLDKQNVSHSSYHCNIAEYWGNLPVATNKDKYVFRDLRCVNILGNNYKKYILSLEGNQLYGIYGSIDVPIEECGKRSFTGKVPYKRFMYWVLYYEKLSKGYEDFTNALKGTAQEMTTKPKTNIAKSEDDELYIKLLNYSKNVVEQTFCQKITANQVARARKIFEELKTKTTVASFNTCLAKLMAISPRKRDFRTTSVVSFTARSERDFCDILDYEENLLIAMETVIDGEKQEKEVKKEQEEKPLSNFEKLGIKVTRCKDSKTIDFIKSNLNYDLKDKVSKVYKVEPRKQLDKFNKYVSLNNISNFKYLWHGSINSNWLSIIQNSLWIGKCSNGRMFGDGIYFAPSARKSWGYTSARGSYWANGNDNICYMGLFKTAYGNAYYPSSYHSSFGKHTLGTKYNCLHAVANRVGLRNDEIIFYDTDAVVLEYIIEFNS